MTFEMSLETALLVAVLIVVLGIVRYCFLTYRQLSQGGEVGLTKLLRDEFRDSRKESGEGARHLREEVAKAQKQSSESLLTAVRDMGKLQRESLDGIGNRVKELTEANTRSQDKMRETVDKQMTRLQKSNEEKLDQMRETVDKKLQTTLEKKLGESFKLVSDNLVEMSKGIGEMQNLAKGVGDLKGVLTNVKARGTLGEIQLGNILEQILAPGQYQRKVSPKPDSSAQVEYAVKFPVEDEDNPRWLPIDAKFPKEDYERLLDTDASDKAALDKATKALVSTVEKSAKDISQKYIAPPYTTDIAIMFLATEGLYAEVVRQPGLVEKLLQNHSIVVAGPTTLSAILSSLRMGFHALTIQKRSGEVWKVLAAVKTEFGKFGDVLMKVKRQLASASNTIEGTEVRTRAMTRKLREVETDMSHDESAEVLELTESAALPRSELVGDAALDSPKSAGPE